MNNYANFLCVLFFIFRYWDYILYFLKNLSSYDIVLFFIHFSVLRIELSFCFITNFTWINVHAIFCSIFLSPSIFTLLWLSFDDLEICVVPLYYLRIAPRFSARRYSKSYFLGRRSDLSQNDSSGYNKRLKEATSHASSMKISLLYSLGILSCPKTFVTSEILSYVTINMTNSSWQKKHYYS